MIQGFDQELVSPCVLFSAPVYVTSQKITHPKLFVSQLISLLILNATIFRSLQIQENKNVFEELHENCRVYSTVGEGEEKTDIP